MNWHIPTWIFSLSIFKPVDPILEIMLKILTGSHHLGHSFIHLRSAICNSVISYLEYLCLTLNILITKTLFLYFLFLFLNIWQFGGKNTEQTGQTGDNECEDEKGVEILFLYKFWKSFVFLAQKYHSMGSTSQLL